jgi:hypothetical protein
MVAVVLTGHSLSRVNAAKSPKHRDWVTKTAVNNSIKAVVAVLWCFCLPGRLPSSAATAAKRANMEQQALQRLQVLTHQLTLVREGAVAGHDSSASLGWTMLLICAAALCVQNNGATGIRRQVRLNAGSYC